MVFENAKFMTKITGALVALYLRLLYTYMCKLRPLLAGSNHVPVLPPRPPFLGKLCCIFPSKLCFQLHSISLMLPV